MGKFKVTDKNTGKSYIVTAPDQGAAFEAFKKFTAAPTPAPLKAAGATKGYDPGLPIPGMPVPAGAPPINTVPPNEHFGLSSSDTLNPLPALSAMGNNLAASVPVAGPSLKRAGENVDAFLDNKVYRPLTGQPGVTTPEDVAATNARQTAANPEATAIGKGVGKVAPYMAAAEIPLVAQTMGMAGPWIQRAIMTGLSQQAINTGDNLAHGQQPVEAATNAIGPSVASIPFSILGKSGKAADETTAARRDAAETLKQEGVQLTAGQQRGSKAMMQFESQTGGSAAQGFRDKQLSQFTKAALKRAGIDAETASPPVMQKAFTDAGTTFNKLAAMTAVKADAPLQNGLLKVVTDYHDLTGTPAPILENFVNRVGTIAQKNGGILKGDNYEKLMTDITEAAKSTSDGTLKIALGKLKSELDDAVERSMGGQTKAAWRKARQQYANLKIIQDGVDGAGEYAHLGILTPEALSAAVRTGDSTRYVKGWGDLNPLTRAGVITMPRLPDSGTASRLAPLVTMSGGVQHLVNGGDIPSSLAIAAGGALAPAALGRMVLSKPIRELLAKGSNIPASVVRGTAPMIAESIPRLIGG